MRRSLHRATCMTLVLLAAAGSFVAASRAADTDKPVTLSHGSFLGVQQAVDIAVKRHPH